MSMDLNFWRYKENVPHDDVMVYHTACCEGETVDTLETLPVAEILEKLARTFSDWTALDAHTYEKEDRGAFQVSTTSQTVRFDCYGMSGDDMNRLMDVLLDYGCPLYDPQVETRFDGWTDR